MDNKPVLIIIAQEKFGGWNNKESLKIYENLSNWTLGIAYCVSFGNR